MPHRIQALKPKMRRSAGTIDAAGNKPALAYDSSSDIIMFKEQSWTSIAIGWLKTSLLFSLSSVLIGFVIYIILAGTILFFANVDGKMALVARGTFLGGEPATGDVALASQDLPASSDPLSKIKDGTFGVGNSMIVEVLAAPNTVVEVTSSGVKSQDQSFDGPVNIDSDLGSKIQLGEEAAVRCLAGSCTKGEIFILDQTLIYGDVRNAEEFR